MKVKLIILIFIAYAFNTVNAMDFDPSEFAFNIALKSKYKSADGNEQLNISEHLHELFTAIIKDIVLKLNKLTSENTNLIFILPKELPSLKITCKRKLKVTNNFEWENRLHYIKKPNLSMEEISQLQQFKITLNAIFIDLQKRLQILDRLHFSSFSNEIVIIFKIQLHFSDNKPKYSLITNLLNYCSTLHNVYRW